MRQEAHMLDLLQVARELRQRQTPPEEILWALLRGRKFLGLKFRRQQQIGPFIADFYCHEARLVIEVDGEIHQEHRQADRDHNRDIALEEQRLRVLRIPNHRILDDIESVFREIARATSRWWREPYPSPSSTDTSCRGTGARGLPGGGGRAVAPLSRAGGSGGRERGRG